MGGVLSSTLLTLVLVPGVYTMLDDARELLLRTRRGRTVAQPAPAPTPRAARIVRPSAASSPSPQPSRY